MCIHYHYDSLIIIFFQMKERIVALEEANLTEKPWQMGGEATAKSRPENR